MVTASWDKTERVWDAATGKALSEPIWWLIDQIPFFWRFARRQVQTNRETVAPIDPQAFTKRQA